MLRGLCNRVAFDQNVFATELVLWIASFRRVAVRLHAVMEIKNLSSIAQRIVDLFFCPDIKGAFGCLPVAGIVDPGYNTVGIFSREKSAFLRCHVAGGIIENVTRDCFVLPVPRD